MIDKPNTIDPIVVAVASKLFQRSQRGVEKYGTDLTRTDLSHADWLNHLQQELLDGANYVERLLRDGDDYVTHKLRDGDKFQEIAYGLAKIVLAFRMLPDSPVNALSENLLLELRGLDGAAYQEKVCE